MNTILIVDQSLIFRQIISDLLSNLGCQIITASSGIEAQNIIKRQLPDLVITDVVLPWINGYELCVWLKQDPQCHNIPVVICSHKNSDFDRYWGFKKGANAYLAKPFQAQELINTAQKLLYKQQCA